ncbi:MAG: tRNA (guanosine(37)-N1)-methyltransferase TrmD, partial [Pseudomonadota bacterium]
NDDTTSDESHENGLLEYPQYTRPAVWIDKKGAEHPVPDILTSGHHENIRKWRKQQSETLTREKRPDLWALFDQKS